MKKKDYFKISNKKFLSRLIVGTGKYKNFVECAKAVKAWCRNCNSCSKKSKYN